MSTTATHAEGSEPARTRFAKDQLKSFVERIERLSEEKQAIADDIRDIYAEAKGNGFDIKALRAIITLRKQDPQERSEHELILETYMNALGMLPLFDREPDPPQSGGGSSGSKSGQGGGAAPKSGAKQHGASASSTDTDLPRAIAESEAGGGSPTLAAIGPVLPPVTWRAASLVEIDLTEIPPTLLRGNSECWVRGATGPHGLRPP